MDLAQFVADHSSPENLAASLARRRALADAVECSPDYLWQIATGRRQAGPKLARKISEATLGVVTLEALRPDVWGDTDPH
jgi:DNA-binding transcriptional regulator YdaS (Cro superfamily)